MGNKEESSHAREKVAINPSVNLSRCELKYARLRHGFHTFFFSEVKSALISSDREPLLMDFAGTEVTRHKYWPFIIFLYDGQESMEKKNIKNNQ